MAKSVVKPGPADTLIIFGGGKLVIDFAKESMNRNLNTHVFAARRHLEEVIESEGGLTLESVLKKEGISFFNTKDINHSPELKPVISENTIGIGLGETYTFTGKTIDLFKRKLFDFMTIKLPQYRGGAHFTWQILQRDRIGCWNVQMINEEMIPGVYDSGGILKTRQYCIPDQVRIPEDYFKIAHKEGLDLFIEFLNEVQSGKEFGLVPLQERDSSYFPRLHTLKHGFVDWSWNAREIEEFICAFDDPYVGASTFLDGKKVFLKHCWLEQNDTGFHPFMVGLIYRIHGNSVFIAAKDGTLKVDKIIDEQGGDMKVGLKVGQRLYTPRKYLEEAMLFNAEYDSEGLVKTEE